MEVVAEVEFSDMALVVVRLEIGTLLVVEASVVEVLDSKDAHEEVVIVDPNGLFVAEDAVLIAGVVDVTCTTPVVNVGIDVVLVVTAEFDFESSYAPTPITAIIIITTKATAIIEIPSFRLS